MRYFLIIIVVLMLSITACQDITSPAQPVDKVKIGVLFPLSGSLADTGKNNKNGVVLAAEEINATGGIASLDGAELELIIGDTQGIPDIGIQEVRWLVEQENVSLIIGAYQSSVTRPAVQTAEQLKTPFVVSMAIADAITEQGFQYVFRVCPKAQFYARDQVLFLKDLATLADYDVKRVVLLYENTDFGTSTTLAQRQALQEHGMEVVGEFPYVAEGLTDLSHEMAEIKAIAPDAILTATYHQDSVLIAKTLVEFEITIPVIDAAGGTIEPEYIAKLGSLAEGMLTALEFSKHAANSADLNSNYHARFDEDITANGAYAYQATYLIKDALQRAGTTDREQLRQALHETNITDQEFFVLPMEQINFDEHGQNNNARLFIAQIQNGELVPVWPSEFAVSSVWIQK